MALFDVGKYLHKSVSEVLEMPLDEIKGWAVHMRIKNG